MKSGVTSVGKFFPFFAWIGSAVLVIGLLGCATGRKSQETASNPANLADELNEEISLKSDRERLAELRKDIPKEQQVQNDELSMDLELLAKADKKPTRIRSEFQRQLSKLRNNFR